MSEQRLEYKGYQGSVEVSLEDNVLHGKILHIVDLVTFEALTPDGLRQAFETQVDEYMEFCENEGVVPDKPWQQETTQSQEMHDENELLHLFRLSHKEMMSNITFEFATHDDCLDKMVPSDLRLLVGDRDRLITRNRELEAQAEANNKHDAKVVIDALEVLLPIAKYGNSPYMIETLEGNIDHLRKKTEEDL